MSLTQTNPAASVAVGTDAVEIGDIQAAARLDLRGVFNVKDAAYGAVGDGSTDDRPALAAALTAAASGGVVYLPAGTYLLNTTGPLSLPKLSATQSLKIVGAGANATTIKLSTTCKRAFDLRRVADYDVFQNIEISDLTVNANSVATADNNHVLLGNLVDGAWDQRLNFRNIAVRRCRTINVPAANTDGNTTGSRQNVSIVSRHLGTGEGTQTYCKDIVVEDCDFGDVASATPAGGGVGVDIGGSAPGGVSTNVFVDRIVLNRVKHDTGVTPTAPPGSISHAGAQIGGQGFGGSCVLRDCFFRNSNDVAYEIDGMTDATLDNVVSEDSWTCGGLLRNFATPLDASAQSYVLRNCHHRIVNITPPATSVYVGNSYGWFLSGSGAPTFGHVALENCSYINKSASFVVNGEAIACPELPLKHLTLRNFTAIHETISTGAMAAPNWSMIRYGPSTTNHLEVYGWHISVGGTYGGTAGSLRHTTFEGAGPTTFSIYDPVFENSLTATGSTQYLMWFGKNAGSADAHLSGTIERGRCPSWTGTATGKFYGFVGSTALTIDTGIRIVDHDGSALPSGVADTLFGDTTNRPKVILDWSFLNPVSTVVASATTTTLPVSGNYFTISGTTNITSVTASWKGRVVTLNFLGVLTFTDGSNLALAGNLTTTADDTITLVCDGTNWYEIARSVN